MLDENLEYLLYLSADTDDAPLRSESMESGTGLRRPLRILARGFLDKCETYSLNLEQQIRYCKQFLDIWLTGEAPKDLDIPEAYEDLRADLEMAKSCNLPYHAKKLLLDTKIKNGKYSREDVENAVEETVSKLLEKVKFFQKPPYYASDAFANNDFNQIRLDQIISDALIRKPLRKHLFVFQNGDHCGLASDGQEHLIRVTLGTICFYLQAQDEAQTHIPQSFVPITQQEIANWLDTYAKNKGEDKNGKWKECVSKAMSVPKLANGIPLFHRIILECGVKVRVNSDWLKAHDAKLITEKQIAEYLEKGYTILDDGDFCISSDNRKAKQKFTEKIFHKVS